ncbi:hypothetical protein N9N28_06505 [Rubripirellula amarantea]|nr:hypothetical protein [Rubripirellula amarantea]
MHNGFRNLHLKPVAGRLTRVAVACTMALSLALAPCQESLAQEKFQPKASPGATANATEPVLVVTLGSINKLMQDINYVTAAVGQPNAGMTFGMFAGMFAQGINLDQPIGVLVPLVDGAPQPIALLPTNDIKATLKRLEAQTGPADQLDDGTFVISVGANTIFIRQMDSWAALAPQKDLLDLAPADPSSLFDGMGNKYDLAFRIKLQQVPAETRNMLVAQIRQGFEQAMQKQAGGNPDQARDVAETSMKQLEQFINETDELNFGLNIDQANKEIVADTAFVAVDGTKLASLYGGAKPIPSAFASVIREDAAAYYHAATSISPEAIDQTRASMQSSLGTLASALENEDDLNPAQRADIKEMIDRIAELAMDSIAEGRADVGALLLTDTEKFQFVFGSFVSDGSEAAQIAKDIAAKVQDDASAPRFEFDRSVYNGVTMHLIEADVPESEDEARRVFGDTLQVHIGTGEKSVYVAIGPDSENLLKGLIDSKDADKGADRPIGQLKFRLLPILEYANAVEANDAISAMIAELSRSADPGLLTVVQDVIHNGQETKITVGEGLLKAIGAAIQQAQQAQMQQGQF